MKKLLISLLLCCSTIYSFAQIEKQADEILRYKDFTRFEKFADSLNTLKGNVRSHWEYKRELVKGYWEGVLYFERSAENKANKGTYSVNSFRVNIIATDSTIIYFDLLEVKSKKVSNEWVPDYVSSDTYKNDNLFTDLNTAFKKTFRAELNFSELFNLTIVYSDGGCGYGGRLRKEKMQIDELVLNNDRLGLQKWLSSSNTETQLYAVDGFYHLQKNGALLTPVELEMINAVQQKKGTVQTCSGCSFGLDQISSVCKRF
jgi:hypothetical protein